MKEKENTDIKVMDIYLGIKLPAVCCTDERKSKFVENGGNNKYIRRKYNTRQKF